MKQTEKARDLFRSAVQVDPACANFEIGKILVSAGDLKGAVERYRRTLECDPNWLHLNGEIAVLLARQRRFDEAIPYAERAVQVEPQNADAHYNLGLMLAQEGKFQAAVGPLEAALRLNPQHPKAPRELERVRKALGGQD
jgi:tetratricopeptide (TPR) repeat protein